ncbi:MAG TPA: sulfatase-like hydrolase/transferase [Clostridiales bacterium]|nr:sulfatase-like hydrolase/transferase [Clostridiales bacterium]
MITKKAATTPRTAVRKTTTVRRARNVLITKTAFFYFFPLSILYLELIFRAFTIDRFFDVGLVYILLFSFSAGFFLTVLSTFFAPKINRRICIALLSAVTLIYIIQLVYTQVFGTFLIIYSFAVGGDILQFRKTIISAIIKRIPAIALTIIPLIIFIYFGKGKIVFFRIRSSQKLFLALIGVLIHLIAVFLITINNFGTISARFLYSEEFIPDASVAKFGLLTTERLDLTQLLFSSRYDDFEFDPGLVSSQEPSSSEEQIETQQPQYTDQVMNIDFESLIANETDSELLQMHNYFSNQTPTKTNRYTGMFKGKNLVFVTAEGFSPYVIDKELTPTLYKMKYEGFNFKNFYTPIWGVSTSDGEYVACTGLLPKPGVWSFSRSSQNYLPFCMGNQFAKLSVKSFAYHNNTYTYYDRHLSHPNMGYIYKGLGNGLEVTNTWPQSDVEMIELSMPDYINYDRFNVYYMTVSGHLQYTFKGNYISYKNRDLVSHLNYSDHVKAYLACNIELDRAMEVLLNKLNELGKAEDTVFVISPDHYPYGLTKEEIDELAGKKVEQNFELYKGELIIYCQGMQPVEIEKPASSLDIIPTISNLFGLEYDSRLLMGQDILSDSSPLVIFSNRSWITDKGKFYAKTGKFEAFEGQSIEDGYVKQISNIVNGKFKMSQKILERDYYRIVFQHIK